MNEDNCLIENKEKTLLKENYKILLKWAAFTLFMSGIVFFLASHLSFEVFFALVFCPFILVKLLALLSINNDVENNNLSFKALNIKFFLVSLGVSAFLGSFYYNLFPSIEESVGISLLPAVIIFFLLSLTILLIGDYISLKYKKNLASKKKLIFILLVLSIFLGGLSPVFFIILGGAFLSLFSAYNFQKLRNKKDFMANESKESEKTYKLYTAYIYYLFFFNLTFSPFFYFITLMKLGGDTSWKKEKENPL